MQASKTRADGQASQKLKRPITLTLKCDPDVYTDINEVRWRLRDDRGKSISIQEFLRRAVARELDYNAKKAKREGV